MNPASIMKMMKAKNTFTANHPKFVSFLQYAFCLLYTSDAADE